MPLWISVGPDGSHIFNRTLPTAFPSSTSNLFSSSPCPPPSHPPSHYLPKLNPIGCIAASPGQTSSPGLNSRRCSSASRLPSLRVIALPVCRKINSTLATQTPRRLTTVGPTTRWTSALLRAPPFPTLREEATCGIHWIFYSFFLRILVYPPRQQDKLFRDNNLSLAVDYHPSP